MQVDVVRKDIKNLHLGGVYPPEGRVRVAAPLRVDDEAVRLAVITKLPWIKRQQTRFRSQERQSPREYTYRETHYYLGKRYLLNVIEDAGPSRAEANKARIDLYVPVGSDAEKREQVMLKWYRKELKALLVPLITKWQDTLGGVTVDDWRVKKMKTKWGGSCNIEARRIWLNLELAKNRFSALNTLLCTRWCTSLNEIIPTGSEN
ncbi:M48 family metallopeptidase [Methanoculleus chikugoensis]|uniref:M48 family metallopeptidase n=1 Tax=Methanoculleus chikugoensis TaxID=118126 RepID=UPI001FB2B896|nr:YgjP-like metallopeptidase domain-containing protein [Methanoculleus chikugoensis]